MKKSLLILALAVFSFANAQKGTILVLGNVGYSTTKAESAGSQNYFSFSPKVGYQFTDNWTVGGELGIYSQKQEYTLQEYKTNGYSAGAFLRYSKPLTEMFSVYADLDTGYAYTKETNSNTFNGPQTTIAKSNGFYVGVTPAIFLNLKKGFGLNFNIGGLEYNTKNYDHSGTDTNSFNFSFGQAFSVGISKNF